MKKIFKNKSAAILFSSLVILLCVIVANFGIHAVRTKRFNDAWHELSVGEESNDVFINSKVNGEWNKEDALVNNVTNGATYEFSVENKRDYAIDEWSLKIEISKECYLNQAWNGLVEIHQNVNSGNEITETLDLHTFELDYDAMKLEYAGEGKNDLMIHLYVGDYIIYHPSNLNGAHEYPLEDSDSSTTIGMIFYYDTSLEISNYTLSYSFGKKFAQGNEFIIFTVLSGVWVLLLAISIAWLILSVKSQHEIEMREAMLNETIGLITRFVDAKDSYTNGHSTRVAAYTKLLAEKLGFDKKEVSLAYYIAILHDIGKCYVPDEILKKPGKLTAEEFDFIKKHTTYGAEMLSSIKSVANIADGAHYHHERYDGNGYPEGLKGEDIPYIARIICVADSFDAMTTNRCYRPALAKEKVLSELETNKGKQFDPKVAEAMIELIAENKIEIPNWKQ